jgi:TonB family protein
VPGQRRHRQRRLQPRQRRRRAGRARHHAGGRRGRRQRRWRARWRRRGHARCTRGHGRQHGRGRAGQPRCGSARASRSIEDIKLVFDRHKGAIHALYNRALRDDPSLQGKVVLELKIAPGGEVVDCRIVASDLKADELERKLLARIRQFDFGAKDVDTMVVSWPVDFLPS